MKDCEVGGRDTDISQIAYSLKRITKLHFPLNKVPKEIEDAYTSLEDILIRGEKEISEYIQLLNNHGVRNESDY